MNWKEHKARWIDCTLCELSERRKSVVLARGKIPCDILFVGEAPGASEDVLRKPFCGPAGKLLDSIIAKAVPPGFKVAFTNLVACIPLDEDGAKTKDPPKKCIAACQPRLVEFMAMVKPSLIVHVGALAAKMTPDIDVPTVALTHPAAILRMDISQRGLAFQRNVVALSDAVEDLIPF